MEKPAFAKLRQMFLLLFSLSVTSCSSLGTVERGASVKSLRSPAEATNEGESIVIKDLRFCSKPETCKIYNWVFYLIDMKDQGIWQMASVDLLGNVRWLNTDSATISELAPSLLVGLFQERAKLMAKVAGEVTLEDSGALTQDQKKDEFEKVFKGRFSQLLENLERKAGPRLVR